MHKQNVLFYRQLMYVNIKICKLFKHSYQIFNSLILRIAFYVRHESTKYMWMDLCEQKMI